MTDYSWIQGEEIVADILTKQDWKYRLSYNCISFIEWIDGLLLKSYIEYFLVIMFYMFDPVVFLSVR